jgi:hypothetical protein
VSQVVKDIKVRQVVDVLDQLEHKVLKDPQVEHKVFKV